MGDCYYYVGVWGCYCCVGDGDWCGLELFGLLYDVGWFFGVKFLVVGVVGCVGVSYWVGGGGWGWSCGDWWWVVGYGCLCVGFVICCVDYWVDFCGDLVDLVVFGLGGCWFGGLSGGLIGVIL